MRDVDGPHSGWTLQGGALPRSIVQRAIYCGGEGHDKCCGVRRRPTTGPPRLRVKPARATQDAMRTVDVRVLTTLTDVRARDWDALLSARSTPFLRYAWLQALEHSGSAGDRAGWVPHHLT